jgi:hypothetical protein
MVLAQQQAQQQQQQQRRNPAVSTTPLPLHVLQPQLLLPSLPRAHRLYRKRSVLLTELTVPTTTLRTQTSRLT